MQGLSNIKSVAVIAASIYGIYLLKKMYSAGDKIAEKATAPAGELLSDVSAWANGWEPVVLTNLIIQPWYLDNNYRLTAEAEKVIKKAYPAEYAHFFNGNLLKHEYIKLIGQPIKAS
jgi:uncharacterized protein (UPF0333 family)